MDTRTRRFVAATCAEGGRNRTSTELGGAGWRLCQLAAHPVNGDPLAVAVTEGVSGRVIAGLALTAVRTGGAVEVSAGVVFRRRTWTNGRVMDVGSGEDSVYIPPNVAPAHRGTVVVRCAWHVAGDAPDVASFRGRSVPGQLEDDVLHLSAQMTARWAEGDPERPESVLSGRTEAFGESDRLGIGIPWLHEDRELALSFPLAALHTAVAGVTALV